jgi:hypothetical protein
MKIAADKPEEVVKEAFWLAWKACGGPLGMGFLQDKPNATKERVWEGVYNRNDYPGGNNLNTNKPGKVYGDYVFGRMMKLWLEWDDKEVTVPDGVPNIEYQAWCGVYPDYQSLIAAAVLSLNK